MGPSPMVVGFRADHLQVIVPVAAILGLMAVGCGESTSATPERLPPDGVEEASLEDILICGDTTGKSRLKIVRPSKTNLHSEGTKS